MPAVFEIRYDTILAKHGAGDFVTGGEPEACRDVAGDHVEDAIRKLREQVIGQGSGRNKVTDIVVYGVTIEREIDIA